MKHSFVVADLLILASGHFEMTTPPTRSYGTVELGGTCKVFHDPLDKTAADGLCRWFSQGCQPGCSRCTDTFGTNPCVTPKGPTIRDPDLITFGKLGGSLLFANNPWRAPGFAPILSPCGIAGGGKTYHPSNGGEAPQGYQQGMDGRDLPKMPGVNTRWQAGSVVEVSWAIHANHGGGYAYRLCPNTGKSSDLTEECFQAHHLQFVGDQSWIQYGTNKANRTAIKAHRVSVGTHPAGSQWTKNPIPACGDASGGVSNGERCTYPAQFKEPLPGLYGYGAATCAILDNTGGNKCTPKFQKEIREKFKFNIFDKVQIPSNLPSGEYVLSYRIDCEQTPQIWAQCADVTITGGGPTPPPAPTPTPVPTPPVPTPVPSPTPGCQDKDLSCRSLSETYCGKSLGGCLGDGCPDDTYTWEFVDFSGGQCHYHCTCKKSAIIV